MEECRGQRQKPSTVSSTQDDFSNVNHGLETHGCGDLLLSGANESSVLIRGEKACDVVTSTSGRFVFFLVCPAGRTDLGVKVPCGLGIENH